VAKEKRLTWTLLGREIGTATGWDQADTFVMQLYDFKPHAGIDLPCGTISINFETGLAESWNDDGQVIQSADIVKALSVMTSQQGKTP
jgi:hypothetical protein